MADVYINDNLFQFLSTSTLNIVGGGSITSSSNGDISLVPNGTGVVYVGSGSPSYLTPTSGELYVQGKSEFALGSYYAAGASIYGDGQNFYMAHYDIASYGGFKFRASAQTPDTNLILTGTVSNAYILCENADAGFDFGHAQATNPTLFIHSANQATNEWISFAHDQTYGLVSAGTALKLTTNNSGQIVLDPNGTALIVLENDAYLKGDIQFDGAGAVSTTSNGNISLVPNGTGVVYVGSGTPGHLTPTSGELYVQGKAEFDGFCYLDGNARVASYLDGAAANFSIQASDPAAHGCLRLQASAQTVDTTMFLTGTTSNHIVIAEYADRTFDFAHAQATDPTLFIHSANQSTSEWLSLTHDQTDGLISAGTGLKLTTSSNGDITLTPNGTGIVVCGTGSPSTITPSSGDLYVSGEGEFTGAVAFATGWTVVTGGTGASFYDNIPLMFGDSADCRIFFDASTNNAMMIGAPDSESRSVIIADTTDIGKNFDHANQSNPTLWVHAATDPDSDNTHWARMTHTGNNALFDSGTGLKLATDNNGNIIFLPDGTGVVVVGADNNGHLSGGDDLFVYDDLEVDGQIWCDGGMTIPDDTLLTFGTASDVGIEWNEDQTNAALEVGLGASNALIVCEKADMGTNWGHSAYTNPMLVLHSATTTANDYMRLCHNATDGILAVGSGGFIFKDASNDVFLLDGGIHGFPESSYCRVYSTDGQSMTNGDWTTIAFNGEVNDIRGEIAAGIFTATEDGVYQCSWATRSESTSWTAGEVWVAALSINSAETSLSFWYGNRWMCQTAGTYYAASVGSHAVKISAGSTLEIKVYHTQGAAVALDANARSCYFTVVKVQ